MSANAELDLALTYIDRVITRFDRDILLRLVLQLRDLRDSGASASAQDAQLRVLISWAEAMEEKP